MTLPVASSRLLSEVRLSNAQLSAPWLSAGMAQALAAMCPPLTIADVSDAAQKLATRGGPTPAVDVFLRLGADLMKARQVVEALTALRELEAAEVDSATVLDAKVGGNLRAPRDLAVADQVFEELVHVLSRLTSPAGAHTIIVRAISLAEVDFPFLEQVHPIGRQAGFGPFSESMTGVAPGEAGNAAAAVLRHALSLVSGCVGEDLTARLLRRV